MLVDQSIVKNILSKFIILIGIMIMFDLVIGGLFQSFFNSQESGKYYRISEALNKTDADILIFGSSRAITNYDPQIIEDSIGFTCYNAGVTAQSILFAYAMQKIIIKRYHPKLIILNVEPVMLHERPIFYDRLDDLNPFYSKHRNELSEIFDLKSPFLKYALLSKLVAYNSTLLHVLKFKLKPEQDYNGFAPHYRKIDVSLIDTTNIDTSSTPYLNIPIDINYQNALFEFLSNCIENNIKVFGVISPSLFGNFTYESNSFQTIDSIFNSYKVPLIDYSQSKRFQKHYEIWADIDHLNFEGAELFTTILTKELNSYLQLNNITKLNN